MSDDEIIVLYGDAKPGDTHLLAKVVAVDEEIIAWLRRREGRKAACMGKSPTN